MRKLISFVILSGLFITLLTSCSSRAFYPFPYGKWVNDELGLIIDANPQYETRGSVTSFPATYIENGEEISVYALFFILYGELWIVRDYWSDIGDGTNTRTTIVGGYGRVRGDRLRIRLTPFWQEQTGMRDIIFEKVEEYAVTE